MIDVCITMKINANEAKKVFALIVFFAFAGFLWRTEFYWKEGNAARLTGDCGFGEKLTYIAENGVLFLKVYLIEGSQK